MLTNRVTTIKRWRLCTNFCRYSQANPELENLKQVYVLDTDVKVREAIEIAAKEIGSDIKVTGYIRYKIGEGIEQKNDNFAEEVEKMSS